MNNKKILAALMLAIPAASFAQDLTSSTTGDGTFSSTPATEVPAAPEPMYLAAPAASAPAAATADAFDKLRGRAYGDVVFGNAAAAFSAADYIAWPHMMAGNKFLYVEPADQYGTVSANMGDRNVFLNMDLGNNGLPRITVGLANADSWGLAVRVAKDRLMTSDKTGSVTNEETTVGGGDQLGVTFSTKMGSNALAVSADWITPQDEVNNKTANVKTEHSFAEYILDAKYANFYSGSSVTWIAGVTLDRLSLTQRIPPATDDQILDDASTNLTLSFSAGSKILGNETSRVLVGMDDSLVIKLWDDQDGVREGQMQQDLIIAPNIVGEYAINENWMVMGGAKHSMLLFRNYSSTTPRTAPLDKTESSEMEIANQSTTASGGIRYVRTNMALEAGFEQRVFTDGPSSLFTTGPTLFKLGAFLYF